MIILKNPMLGWWLEKGGTLTMRYPLRRRDEVLKDAYIRQNAEDIVVGKEVFVKPHIWLKRPVAVVAPVKIEKRILGDLIKDPELFGQCMEREMLGYDDVWMYIYRWQSRVKRSILAQHLKDPRTQPTVEVTLKIVKMMPDAQSTIDRQHSYAEEHPLETKFWKADTLMTFNLVGYLRTYLRGYEDGKAGKEPDYRQTNFREKFEIPEDQAGEL